MTSTVFRPEYEIGVEVLGELIDGKILTIEAHVGKQLQLVLVVVQDETALSVS